MTNINDYLKTLWAQIAKPYCQDCGISWKSWDTEKLLNHLINLRKLKPNSAFLICSTIVIENKKSKISKETERLNLLGFSRFFNPKSGTIERFENSKPILLENQKLVMVLDRVKPGKFNKKGIQDSIEQAFSLSTDNCTLIELPKDVAYKNHYLRIMNSNEQANLKGSPYLLQEYHNTLGCKQSDINIEKARASLFSFNNPVGACTECKGFGRVLNIDPNLIVPNPSLSIEKGVIHCWSSPKTKPVLNKLIKFCKEQKISIVKPWKDLSEKHKDLTFNNKSKSYVGINPWFKKLERKAYKMHVRVYLGTL